MKLPPTMTVTLNFGERALEVEVPTRVGEMTPDEARTILSAVRARYAPIVTAMLIHERNHGRKPHPPVKANRTRIHRRRP